MNQILTFAAASAPWRSLSSVSRLWNSLTAVQWAAALSAVVLTLGAVLEYRHQLKLLALLSGKWLFRKATPFEVCALQKLLLHALGPILVVVGIAGDFVFGARTFILENRQELGAEQTIASLKNATSANERETAQLRHDNLELLALIQPRELTVEQQKAIGQALRRFSGKSVFLRTYSFDQESMRLSALLNAALKSGGIDVQFAPTPSPLILPVGINVTGSDKSFVDAIKHALSSGGKLDLTDPKWKPTQVVGGIFVGAYSPKAISVDIFVGAKPFSVAATALTVAQQAGQYAAWRTISDEQERIILKHLGDALNGHKIIIFRFADDSELVSFTDRLSGVLSKAMLVTESPWPGKGITTPPGMTFFIGKEREVDFALIVEALDLAGVAQASVLRKTAQHGIRVADNDLLINVGAVH
jgi:hypothetical protein